MDPSSYLFTLVAYALAKSKRRQWAKSIKGFRVGKELTLLSHLQYADDTLLFLGGGKYQLLNLISWIHFWLSIRNENKLEEKSCLVGIDSNLKDHKHISNTLDYPIRNFPIDYCH